MDFFTNGVSLLQKLVGGIGAATFIVGILMYLSAQGDNGGNAATKQQGLGLMMAGGGIFAVAATLIPMLSNFFS